MTTALPLRLYPLSHELDFKYLIKMDSSRHKKWEPLNWILTFFLKLLWWDIVVVIFCTVKVKTHWKNNINWRSLLNYCILLFKTNWIMLMANQSATNVRFLYTSIGFLNRQIILEYMLWPNLNYIDEWGFGKPQFSFWKKPTANANLGENSNKYNFSICSHFNHVEKAIKISRQRTLFEI